MGAEVGAETRVRTSLEAPLLRSRPSKKGSREGAGV